MNNDKGMVVLTSLVAVGILVVGVTATYMQSLTLWPIILIGLIFIPFILLQGNSKYSHLAKKAEHIAFFITLIVIIVGFIVIYTPV